MKETSSSIDRKYQALPGIGSAGRPLALGGTLILVLLAFGHSPGRSQEPEDVWAPLQSLIGSWQGAIDGKLGTGTGERTYRLILGDRFLLSRHSSVRLPQEKSPKGDNHEEMGVFSYDRARKAYVYRQFVIEGFVNQYLCDVGPEGFTCESEKVEGGPEIRARWKVTFVDRYRFEETFELASPGKDYSLLFTNRWTRKPKIPSNTW